MILSFIIIGILFSFCVGYCLCFYVYRSQIYGSSSLECVDNRSESDNNILVENDKTLTKDESLERLVKNHNEEMLKGLGDLRNVGKGIKEVLPINEIEYDEAVFY